MKPYLYQAGRYLLITLFMSCVLPVWAAESLMPPSPIGKPAAPGVMYGMVLKTMDAGGYTYVQVESGGQKVWAAGPITKVKQGDAVRINTNMPMRQFHSKALKRDFPLLYFSNSIVVAPGGHSHTGMPATMSMQMSMPESHKKPAPVKVKPAKHGKTIAELFKQRKALAGKQIEVRGQIVKYVGNLFGKNWIHIRDNSSDKTLLVITKDKTKSDVILVKGKVVLDKDNGIGKIYKVVLDDAKILK